MDTVREMMAFWLCPAAREREFFQQLIGDLALRYDAPVFEPHLTLQGGEVSVDSALEALCAVPAPGSVQLKVERIAFSDEYTKTVFVQFRPSAAASRMSAALAAILGSSAVYQFNPHLSLIYQKMDPLEQERLVREIELPFESVTFDALQIIACPAEIRQRADVEAWRKVGARKLPENSETS